MRRLNRFCCCGSIRTGTYIVGITELIFSILFLCISYSNFVKINHNVIFFYNLMDFTETYNMAYFQFGAPFLSVIAHSLTLVGTIRKNRYFLLPYLILTAILLCISLVLLLVIIGLVAVTWDRTTIDVLLITVFTFSIIGAVVKIYFWLTVFSYYHEISKETGKLISNLLACSAEEKSTKHTLSEHRLIM